MRCSPVAAASDGMGKVCTYTYRTLCKKFKFKPLASEFFSHIF